MGLHHDYEDSQSFSEPGHDEDSDDLDNKRRVRRLLEERLERKRLKEEFKDEFDESNDEFDWDDFDKD